MKKKVLDCVKAVICLPFVVVGGLLIIAGVVCNILASVAFGEPQNAAQYIRDLK